MRKVLFVITALAFVGCARVNVATEKPLKVDITMRLDVYQHLEKDVQSVNDQIYGDSTKTQLNCLFGTRAAYAADDMSAAIQSRKARVATIEGYFSQGYIGENRNALLELRDVPSDMRSDVQAAVNAENSDREAIYRATAEKNGTDVAAARKVFFDGDYKRSPSGYWFQSADGSWKKK